MSKRLNAQERAGFRKYSANIGSDSGPIQRRYQVSPPEPALGSLDERLGILIRRLGGRLTVGKPSAEELASVRRYDAVPGPRGGFKPRYIEQELAA